MASFRTGFKIFGEISLKQGLGRIRSFSEDRKPGQWLPEDQWAVRQPGSTCPNPSEKPKKPPKPSKSWLSICSDPNAPKEPECDVRHNNCPPPPVKTDAPWYSLDNLIPKKKPQEKLSPIQCCREEMKRREMFGEEEEVCESIQDRTFPEYIPPEPSDCCCIPKEPCPAPVVSLSCPLPKELDIMLWCGKPCTDTSRIAARCQCDRLPYEEFRPQKVWKPPPFSLPVKGEQPFSPPPCPSNPIAYSEFKSVDIPKPLYTRYKSVHFCDRSVLFSMKQAQCPEERCPDPTPPLSLPAPLERECPVCEPPEEEKLVCPEKRVIIAASCKPVKIKKAPKYTFRPKLTKLIERRSYKNPLANVKCDLQFRPPENEEDCAQSTKKSEDCEPPKVITGTLTSEPQTFERDLLTAHKPPTWMYTICKPGSCDSPLVPKCDEYPSEPKDWCSETDGLKFYDDNNENITPKPPPDPCAGKLMEEPPPPPPPPPPEPEPVPEPVEEPCEERRDRFVLMPECYNIKFARCDELNLDLSTLSSVDKFIQLKTAASQKCSKTPPIKENILYDLQRLCPTPPFDPSKLKPKVRKAPEPECPQPMRFYRSFSTLSPQTVEKLSTFQSFQNVQRRTECGDSSGKCKIRSLVPRPKPCPDSEQKPDCAEITLPCCPKARLPPDCSVRKPMPICKKKLPPKPSFSECSKDPPPCPKMTECNCWEKKIGGKNRKYSDWAANRGEFESRQLEQIYGLPETPLEKQNK